MKNTRGIAVLLIDLQSAYFNNVALENCRAELVEKTNEIITIARHHDLPIFNVKTEHQKDMTTWTLNMLDDQRGYLFTGSDDAKNIAGLNVEDSIEVIKTRDSAFYDTHLVGMLKNHHLNTLIVCGVSTHTCVFQTAADAYAANFRIILASEAIATHQPKYHKNALTILETEYRQRIMDTSQLKKYIQDNSQKNT